MTDKRLVSRLCEQVFGFLVPESHQALNNPTCYWENIDVLVVTLCIIDRWRPTSPLFYYPFLKGALLQNILDSQETHTVKLSLRYTLYMVSLSS